MVSEFYREPYVELTARKVVGHGILDVVDVGHPVVTAHIAYVEQIEGVDSEPYALECAEESAAFLAVFRRREKGVGEANVEALVGRGAEVPFVACAARGGHGQAVGEDSPQVEFQLGKLGEIVGEEEGETVALVGGAGHLHAVERLLGLHE